MCFKPTLIQLPATSCPRSGASKARADGAFFDEHSQKGHLGVKEHGDRGALGEGLGVPIRPHDGASTTVQKDSGCHGQLDSS
jgi:hypothetical protein